MSVLLFTPKYPPSEGGAAVFYSNLIENCDETEFIVVSEYDDDEELTTHDEPVTLYRVLPRFEMLPRHVRVTLEALILFMMAAYAVVRKDVDIIHAHASSFAVIGLAAASSVFQVPIVNDCRDEAFRPWIVTSGFTPIWFNCASNIDDILIENGVPADRIVRLPVVNPSYVREHREPNREGGVGDIVFVGSIRSAKGVFVLLDALELLHEKEINARLTLIGDGPATAELRARTAKKSLVEHVILTGRLNHRETLDRLARADVLVLPSESEGLPRVVLEAQEVGTPVVATPVGGVPDVITHEKTGMLSDRTAESVANNVARLAQDGDLYRCIVTNGLERSESRGWDQVSDQLQEGYERATNSEL